jgi:hypothetical protein
VRFNDWTWLVDPQIAICAIFLPAKRKLGLRFVKVELRARLKRAAKLI